jgi:hypothetical protein
MAALRGKFEMEQADLASAIREYRARQARQIDELSDMADSRRADRKPADRGSET